MPRFLQRSLLTILDVVGLSVAYWLAFLFRFEFQIPPNEMPLVLVNWPYVVMIHYAALYLFGIPRMSWRYMMMRDAVWIGVAVATSTFALVTIRALAPHFSSHHMVFLPYGVIAMDVVLAFLGLVAARTAVRLRGEFIERNKRATDGGDLHNVLLIGAGEAGVIVAREIAKRPDLRLKPVGFIDDDPMKRGTSIGGLPVLGAIKDIKAIAERKRTRHALITIANATGPQVRRIAEQCRDAGLDTKIIPGIYEIVGAKVNLSQIREIAIEDLLGREPVQLDEDIVGATIGSRVVLVTGAGGSIGSELCRQICRFGPRRLLLVERFENALFEIHRELASEFPHVPLEPIIADVCDQARMQQVFEVNKPELVFHAAAHKHVPMMEWNPCEAVKNNVGGTRVVADLADAHGVERFVLVSTDKAVNPTSVMGATKRIAELYVQACSQRSSTRYVTVRFGNVLGSAGSVIPIFRQQIAKGGPVTVTHPDMTRYFMTIPEASQLVLQAGAMGEGGEIMILDMGAPVKIVDLARDLIQLSGLRPNVDIEIRFSGVRPGEKLFEELSSDAEHADKTKHPKILIGKINSQDFDIVVAGVQMVYRHALEGDVENVRSMIGKVVPEYSGTRPARASTRSSDSVRSLPASAEPAIDPAADAPN
jgi:FlaA1/EpsC-like NDP-sugar epimerase